MPSIAVAVITYARPESLGELLDSLAGQDRAGADLRLVVVDNDPAGSAKAVVEQFAAAHPDWPVHYEVEPEPGIPFARQRSVELCPDDDAVIFVDDDEIAPPGWLAHLVGYWQRSAADVVTGPVRGLVPEGVPAWNHVADVHTSTGRFRTGDRRPVAYTNNTLVSRTVLDAVQPAFHAAFRFTGASDAHFFQRVAQAGFDIRWCEEAVIEERVPHSRTSWQWLTRRGFRSGAGDTMSRQLIRPGMRSGSLSVVLAAGRLGSGLLLLGGAGVAALAQRREDRDAALAKGVRRVCSAAGTVAGLWRGTHEEYRR